ncbi:MAG: hypothetical protein M1816_004061 [Peltula sp. TS41687]|nr:MAG: hypothetical protein M1816_004061 [Peltula sp. TS41687]
MRAALAHRVAQGVSARPPLQSRLDYKRPRSHPTYRPTPLSRAEMPVESSCKSLHTRSRTSSGKPKPPKGRIADGQSSGKVQASNVHEWLDQLKTVPTLNRPTSKSPNSVSGSVTERAETRKVKGPELLAESVRDIAGTDKGKPSLGIRERLREWQEIHGEGQMEGIRILPVECATELSVQPLMDFGEPNSAQVEEEDENMEDCEFEEVEDGIVQTRSKSFVRAGDLVELSLSRSRFEPELAVRVTHVGGMSLCYTNRGHWAFFRPREVRFSVPNFVPTKLIEPLLPRLPAEVDLEQVATMAEELDLKVPRELGIPIIEPMKAFRTESEAVFRDFSGVLNDAHDIVAHETEVRYMSLRDIARKVYGGPDSSRPTSFPALYALHKVLTRMHYGFHMDRYNHRATTSFEIRPKSEARLFKTMEKWVHEYQESLAKDSRISQVLSAKNGSSDAPGQPIRGFLETARKLVSRSRQTRTAAHSDVIGPDSTSKRPTLDSSQPVCRLVTGPKFSDTDRVIIAFLDAWAGRFQIPSYIPASSLGSLIVRATGLYEGEEVGAIAGFRLLQEIGVYSPWEDPTVLDCRVGIPGVDRSSGDKKNKHVAHTAVSDPNSEEMIDTMYEIRQDFRELDVYCIDGATTIEVDDGISIERVPGPTPTYWVHVHVAHPTAYIPPGHPITRVAEYQSYTIYLPEHNHPMLPQALVQSKLSLAKDRAALTISARLNEEGEVIETKVAPSIIRKVTYLTPATLNTILRSQQPSSDDSYVVRVGGDLPQMERTNLHGPRDLSRSQIDDLQLLTSLVRRRHFKRDDVGRNAIRPNMHDVIAYSGPQRTDALSHDRRSPCFWEGDPIIQLRTPRWDSLRDEPETISADKIVGETMVLACVTAARWCSERGIPIPYRGTVEVGKDPFQALTDARSPFSSEALHAGRSSTGRWVDADNNDLVFDFASTPITHQVMGVDVYTRATSPLRRFGDMLVHWQMDAALREEARTGRSLVEDPRTDYLPFSKDDMDAQITRVRDRHLLGARLRHRSTQHWLMQLLVRAVFYGQAALPRTFECFVFGRTRWGQLGYIKMLHLRVIVEPVPWLDESQLEEHDELEVEISTVSSYLRRVSVKPIRLIRRAAEQTQSELWRMRKVKIWSV